MCTPEILDHCRRIGNHFDLYDNAVLSTEVTALDWDDTAKRWIIRTNRGDEMRAKFVAMGTGPLRRPKLPGIPGIETFEGHSFHTSRWDYEYTGGNPAGGLMTGLADKRVGIIGTGATSVQCIPHLSAAAGELFVFQRTPSSIDIRNNHDIDPEWFGGLEPGWQDQWLMNFTILQTGGFADEDLVKDGWTDLSQRIRDRMVEMVNDDPSAFSREAFLSAYRDCDDEKMEEIRARVDSLVADNATANALKPWYRQLCKRPCFHDEYCSPTTTRTPTSSTRTAKASPRSRRPVSSWAIRTTNLTASFSPRGSRSARLTPGAPASRRPVATVSPSPITGLSTACGRCTAATSTASRICSWWASPRQPT